MCYAALWMQQWRTTLRRDASMGITGLTSFYVDSDAKTKEMTINPKTWWIKLKMRNFNGILNSCHFAIEDINVKSDLEL